MGIWESRVVPRIVDRTCGMAQLDPMRKEACEGLRGRVVEIGFGSGSNIGLYPAEVTEIVAVEPSDVAWELSAPRRSRSSVPVSRVGLDGAQLPLDDASVDTGLVTFSLCTIPNVAGALAELRRVVRPGGTLGFAEHGLSPDPAVARWQHRLDGFQQRFFGGCHLTRDIPKLLADQGFQFERLHQDYLPGPAPSKPWGYVSAGRVSA
ncbi:class I SAM-dependent methyltransferase [Nocardioides sp. KC13]|uniref:Class I SAM-dependent methyltransferase n=1 Tax=Nocardioides turkmenicus TaxID=2711220 RepID=A0A6M1QV35_9ACTN|nr:class I SAM-dependent methyltransferase [Nocardioides sp. KC13]NGN93755.1 class I SAM-dependent methyltransferase [Nocardioides sp. KC13]